MPLDNTIWDDIKQDDKKAYSHLYKYFFNRFYNYGSKFTNDYVIIEDAAQEALIILWEKRNSLNTITYRDTYFYGIFRNKLFSRLKEKGKESNHHIIAEPEFSIEHFIIERELDAEIQSKLKKAIAGLTSRQREAIFLRFYEGLSYDEVASILEITTKATYKIVARAINQLKEMVSIEVLLILLNLRN